MSDFSSRFMPTYLLNCIILFSIGYRSVQYHPFRCRLLYMIFPKVWYPRRHHVLTYKSLEADHGPPTTHLTFYQLLRWCQFAHNYPGGKASLVTPKTEVACGWLSFLLCLGLMVALRHKLAAGDINLLLFLIVKNIHRREGIQTEAR